MLPTPNKRASTHTMFALFVASFLLWSLATPIFGAPDEPSHMIRGASIVRGQLDGQRTGPQTFMVDVPPIVAGTPACFAFNPDRPADCQEFTDGDELVSVASRSHDNPPLFHVLTGWPTLLSDGLLSLYLMRFANAIACAGLLALSFHNIRRLKTPGPVALGLAIALTPMVLFLGGPINPSGVATLAGLGLWTSALVLIDGATGRTAARAVTACAIPFWILMLVRRDSLLWGTAIVVLLLCVAGSKRLKELAKLRAVWAWSVASLAGAGVMYQFSIRGNVTKFLQIADAAGGGSTSDAANALDAYLDQIIGHMGWLDTRVPNLVYQGWTVALVALFVSALVFARRRFSASLIGGLVILVGVALIVGSIRFPYLQGRYVLPFAVGLPVIAGYGLSKNPRTASLPRWFAGATMTLLGAMHIMAFTQSLRRFTVGRTGDWTFLVDPQWAPPLPPWLLLTLYCVVIGATYRTFAGLAASPQPPTEDEPPADPLPEPQLDIVVARPSLVIPPYVPAPVPEPALVRIRRSDLSAP